MNSLHDRQRGAGHSRHYRRQRRDAHQGQLEERIVLADGGGADLGRGEREVPIPHPGLGWWQRDPPVVDGRKA